jgi:hypothetical protein
MFKMSLLARLAALGASAAITVSVVALVAAYGLPEDGGARMLAQSTVAAETSDAK